MPLHRYICAETVLLKIASNMENVDSAKVCFMHKPLVPVKARTVRQYAAKTEKLKVWRCKQQNAMKKDGYCRPF